jgi:hypothetical protein
LFIWIERQWLFESEVNTGDIMYSIQPSGTLNSVIYIEYIVVCFVLSNIWYEYEQHSVINSSRQLSQSARLTLIYDPSEEFPKLILMDVKSVLSVAQIYHFVIIKESIFLDTLYDLLPEFVSLEMYLVPLSELSYLCSEVVNSFFSISL